MQNSVRVPLRSFANLTTQFSVSVPPTQTQLRSLIRCPINGFCRHCLKLFLETRTAGDKFSIMTQSGGGRVEITRLCHFLCLKETLIIWTTILMFTICICVSILSWWSLSLSCLLSFLCLFDENLIKAVFAKYNGLDQTLDTTHTCFITNSNHTGIKKTFL